MSKPTHTPGPWNIGAMESGMACVDGPNGEEVTGWIKSSDATLIAAAPDLLEALQLLLAWAKDVHNPNAIARINYAGMDVAIAAIAKAEGA